MIQQGRDIQLDSKERKLLGDGVGSNSGGSRERLSLNDIVDDGGQEHLVVGERVARISLMTPTTSPAAAATMSNGALANGHTISSSTNNNNNNINNNINVDNLSFGPPTVPPIPTTSYGTSGRSSPSIVDQRKPTLVEARGNNNIIDISTSNAGISAATCDNIRDNNTMGLLRTVDQPPAERIASGNFLYLKTTGTNNNNNNDTIGSNNNNNNQKTGGENGDKQLVMTAMVDCKKLMVGMMDRDDEMQKQKDGNQQHADIDNHDCEDYRAAESYVQESLDDGIEMIGDGLPSLEMSREQPRGNLQDQDEADEQQHQGGSNKNQQPSLLIGSGGDDHIADDHIGPTMTTMSTSMLPTIASTTATTTTTWDAAVTPTTTPVTTTTTTEAASSGILDNYFRSASLSQLFSFSLADESPLFPNQIQNSQGSNNGGGGHVSTITQNLSPMATASVPACSSSLMNSMVPTVSTLTSPFLGQSNSLNFDNVQETSAAAAAAVGTGVGIDDDIDDDAIDIDLQHFSSIVDEEALCSDARDFFDSMSGTEFSAVEAAVNDSDSVTQEPQQNGGPLSAPPISITQSVPPAPPPIISPEELKTELVGEQRSLKGTTNSVFRRLKRLQLQQTHRSFTRQMKTFVEGEQRLASISCQTFEIDPALNPATALPYKMVRNEIAMIKGVLPNLSPNISWPPLQSTTNFSAAAAGSIPQFVSVPQQAIKSNNITAAAAAAAAAITSRNFTSPQKSTTLSSLTTTNISVPGLNSQPRIDGIQQQPQQSLTTTMTTCQPAAMLPQQQQLQHSHPQSQPSIVPASHFTAAATPSGTATTAFQIPYEVPYFSNEGNLQQVRNIQQHLQQRQQQQMALFAQTAAATKQAATTRLISGENRDRLLGTLDTLSCNLRHMETKYDSDATESSSGPESDDEADLLSFVNKAAANALAGGVVGSGLDGASGSVGALDDMGSQPGEQQQPMSSASLLNISLANTPAASTATSSTPASTEKEYIAVRNRAQWKWQQARTLLASKWAWVEAQVVDMDTRLRHVHFIRRMLRTNKGQILFGFDEKAPTRCFPRLVPISSNSLTSMALVDSYSNSSVTSLATTATATTTSSMATTTTMATTTMTTTMPIEANCDTPLVAIVDTASASGGAAVASTLSTTTLPSETFQLAEDVVKPGGEATSISNEISLDPTIALAPNPEASTTLSAASSSSETITTTAPSSETTTTTTAPSSETTITAPSSEATTITAPSSEATTTTAPSAVPPATSEVPPVEGMASIEAPETSSATDPTTSEYNGHCMRTLPFISMRSRKLYTAKPALSISNQQSVMFPTAACTCSIYPLYVERCVSCCANPYNRLNIEPDWMRIEQRQTLLDAGSHPHLAMPSDNTLDVINAHILQREYKNNNTFVYKSKSNKKKRITISNTVSHMDCAGHSSTCMNKLAGDSVCGHSGKKHGHTNLISKLKKRSHDTMTGGEDSIKPKKKKKKKRRLSAEESDVDSMAGPRGRPRGRIRDRNSSQNSESFYTLSDQEDDSSGGAKLTSSTPTTPSAPLNRRRRSEQQAYDINNIVIPYSIAAATHVEKLHYKEIITPKWRILEQYSIPPPSTEATATSKTAKTIAATAEPIVPKLEEDITDQAFEIRHAKWEATERQRILTFYTGLKTRKSQAGNSKQYQGGTGVANNLPSA